MNTPKKLRRINISQYKVSKSFDIKYAYVYIFSFPHTYCYTLCRAVTLSRDIRPYKHSLKRPHACHYQATVGLLPCLNTLDYDTTVSRYDAHAHDVALYNDIIMK